MIDKKINVLISEGFQKFASRDDYISKSQKFLGNRLVKIALSENDFRNRIPKYNENKTVRDAAKNATILFNDHIGIVSTVNELKTASEVDPEEFVFFRCRSIDAGGFEKNGNDLSLHGFNDNGDYFSVEELLKPRLFSTRDGEEKNVHAFETFVGKLFFTNHKNDDVSEGKGMIINSYYDLEDHCVYCDIMVDAIANPELARAIKQGYLKDVSMGCAVEWSECSICGNKASNVNEYCEHIKASKGRKLSQKDVYEINHDLKFIEISAVTEGAFKNCTIDEILSQDEILKTVEEMHQAYDAVPLKVAFQTIENCKKSLADILSAGVNKISSMKNSKIIIEASEEHLGKLYKSLDLIREVIMEMIKLENIDYDYVSDLTKIMKDLQASIFDLASAGFNEDDASSVQIAPPSGGNAQQSENKFQQGTPPPATGKFPTVEELPKPQPQQNIPQKEELPLAAKKIVKKEDLLKISEKVGNVIVDCNNVQLGLKNSDGRESIANQNSCEYDPEEEQMKYSVVVKPFKMIYSVQDDIVRTYYHDKLIKEQPLTSINKVAATLMRNDPINVLENRTRLYKDYVKSTLKKIVSSKNLKNSRGNQMTQANVKTSATDKILYKQLEEDLGGKNSRHVRDMHEVDLPILEGLLDELDTTPETGASEYMLEGKVQSGRTSNERINPVHEADKPIIEGQLGDNKRRVDDDVSPINYGTTEKQMEERSGEFTTARHHADRTEELLPITEGQMDDAENDIGNKRLEYALLSITEEQMKGKREDDSLAGESGQTKWSCSAENMKVTAKDVGDLVLTALTNAVIKDRINPQKVVAACGGLESRNLTTFNSNDSIQKFAAPIRTEEDIVNRIALRIAEINHNYGLSSNDKKLNEKWDSLLKNVISSFNNNNEKFIKVLSNKSNEYVQNLEEVISGQKEIKTADAVVKERFSSILDEYLPEDKDVQIVNTFMTPEDFKVVEDGEEIVLSKQDEEKYLKHAAKLIGEIIQDKYQVKVSEDEIKISDIDDSNEEIINCKASVKSMELMKISENMEDDVEDEDDEDDEPLTEAEAMKKAIRTVFAQQAPGGFVGGPSFGGPQDQQTPPPAGGPDPGLGAMSTPPPADFNPLDTEEGSDATADGEVGTPKLPGMRCPVCGEINDLENIDNKIRCGNCASEFTVKVSVDVTKNSALENEGQDNDVEEVPEEGEDFTEGEDIQNELNSTPTAAPGAAPGAGGAAPPPMASNKNVMKKISGIPTLIEYTAEPEVLACNTTVVLASEGKVNKEVGFPMAPGHRCPSCASLEMHCEDSKFQCLACGTKGKFKIGKNKEDSRFVDVAVSFIARNAIEKVSKDDAVFKKYSKKIRTAKSIMNQRTSEKALEKSVEESLIDAVNEIHEDGYSMKDAQILKDVIIESMIAERLIKKSEDETMSTDLNQGAKYASTIKISAEEESEFDKALSSSDVDDEVSPGEDDDVSVEVDVEDDAADDTAEYDTAEDDVSDEMPEDIVVLEDEEDDMVDEFGEEPVVNIEIETPAEDINIEVDEEGNVEVETGEEEDLEDEMGEELGDEMGEEAPDYFGDDEAENLGEIAPELNEDFVEDPMAEDSMTEDPMGEDPMAEESEPLGREMASPEESEMMEFSKEDHEIKMLKDAALMNTQSIHKMADGFGNTMAWDLVCRAMGKDRNQIKEEAKKVNEAKAIVEAKNINFNNPTDVVRRFLTKQAASIDQTQPLDVEDDVDAGIPRKPEVGLKKVDYDPVRPPVGGKGGGVTEVKTDKYEKGASGSTGGETSVIPRSNGDSGIAGIPKAKFVEEKANKATSGNPDDYVQKFTPSQKPTPKSSEKNRVRASDIPEITKIAEKNGISIKDISVKKLGNLHVAAHGSKVWKWGSVGKDLSQDVEIDYPGVVVKISKDGKLTKKSKKQVKTSKSKNIVKIAALAKTANNGVQATKIFSKAQNVPEEFIEYADFEDEFLVRDTRDPEKKFFKIRKSSK